MPGRWTYMNNPTHMKFDLVVTAEIGDQKGDSPWYTGNAKNEL